MALISSGVADIHIAGKVVRKGFLGQAKRTEPGELLDNNRWQELEQQAERTLSRSPHHSYSSIPNGKVSASSLRSRSSVLAVAIYLISIAWR